MNPTKENAKRVYGALKEFAAPLHGTTEEFFTEKESFLIVGVAPNRFDILKSIPGVEFEDCWRSRQVFEVGGVEAYFPSLESLLAAKIAAGRPQDLADVVNLRAALEMKRKQERGT